MNELETESISFVDPIVEMHRWNVEAAIYQARAHGLRAGVRPNTEPPKSGEEDYFWRRLSDN
jgi:hypothetical protein